MRQWSEDSSSSSQRRYKRCNKNGSQASQRSSTLYSPQNTSSMSRKIDEMTSSNLSSLERRLQAIESDFDENSLGRSSSRSKLMNISESSPKRYQPIPEEQRRFPKRQKKQEKEDYKNRIVYSDEENEDEIENNHDGRNQASSFMDGLSRFNLSQSSRQIEVNYQISFIISLAVIAFLYFTQENCLSEFKKLNCSTLENRDSSNCQYYRGCLAEEDETNRLFYGIIFLIVSGIMYYYRMLRSQD